jgi:hypothetical protein
MILFEATIDGSTVRASINGQALTHWWPPHIAAIDNPQYAMATDTGGFVALTCGSITLSPDFFTNISEWPPGSGNVDFFSCELSYTTETLGEAGAISLFKATAQFRELNDSGVVFDFYRPTMEETISGTTLNGTIASVMTTILGGSTIAEIATVNVTNCDGSTYVNYTFTDDRQRIDLASEICAAFGHFFYLDGTTCYVYDMDTATETDTLTEFDYMPSSYWKKAPIAVLRAEGTNYYQQSSYAHGTDNSVTIHHPTQANIEAALLKQITLQNGQFTSLQIPIENGLYKPGAKISGVNTRLAQSTDWYVFNRIMELDPINNMMVITGDGSFTASA